MTTNEDKSTAEQLEFARREAEQQEIEDARFRAFKSQLVNVSSLAMCLPLDVVDRQDTQLVETVLGQLQRSLDRRGIKPAEQFVQFDNVDASPLTCIHSSARERS